MDDLVKRLRSVPPCNGCGEYPGGDIAQIMDVAATHIAALETQVRAADALAEALEAYLDQRGSTIARHRNALFAIVAYRESDT